MGTITTLTVQAICCLVLAACSRRLWVLGDVAGAELMGVLLLAGIGITVASYRINRAD